MGDSPNGKALRLHRNMNWFDSNISHHFGSIAQSGQSNGIITRVCDGSNPSTATICKGYIMIWLCKKLEKLFTHVETTQGGFSLAIFMLGLSIIFVSVLLLTMILVHPVFPFLVILFLLSMSFLNVVRKLIFVRK